MKEVSRREALQQGLTGLVAVAASGTLLSRTAQAGYDPVAPGTRTPMKDQCGDPEPPEYIWADEDEGNWIACPSADPESGREYGALIRGNGTGEVVLYEGADFDPFDGSVIYDQDGGPNDTYKMRVICGSAQDDSASVPLSLLKRSSQKRYQPKSHTPIPNWPYLEHPPAPKVDTHSPHDKPQIIVPVFTPAPTSPNGITVTVRKSMLFRRQLNKNLVAKRRKQRGDFADQHSTKGRALGVIAYLPWKVKIAAGSVSNPLDMFGDTFPDDLSLLRQKQKVSYVTVVVYEFKINNKKYRSILSSPEEKW